jgi:hypothetical protein
MTSSVSVSSSSPSSSSSSHHANVELTNFDAAVVGDLGRSMRRYGIYAMVFGVVAVLACGVSIASAVRREPVAFVPILPAAFLLVTGFAMRSAGKHFIAVQETAGGDLAHILSALREMNQLFRRYALLIWVGSLASVAALVVARMIAQR